MLAFWRNPEFIRHCRAQLRPSRLLTAVVLVVVVATLIVLANLRTNVTLKEIATDTFYGFLYIQFGLLGLWSAYGCGQGLAREREMKTFDFLRTTRLTSGELLIGKLLGEPVLGYVIVLLSLPFSVIAGFLSGVSFRVLLLTYVLLLLMALFHGLIGLCTSMVAERSSGAAAALAALAIQGIGAALIDSPLTGAAAFSVAASLMYLYGVGDAAVITSYLLDWPVSFPLLTVLLYGTFGVWLALMLLRNLKKEPDQVRLLSHGQSIGFAAFINLWFFALIRVSDSEGISSGLLLTVKETAWAAVFLNGFCFATVGILTLAPPEQLKSWWRRYEAKHDSYLSPDGLPWPWMLPVGILAYLVFAAQTLPRTSVSIQSWPFGMVALQMVVVLVFVMRDILFLQWCMFTRMKNAVMRGVLYLFLYYVAASILGATVSMASYESRDGLLSLLTPWTALAYVSGHSPLVLILLGAALQVGAIGAFIVAIHHRLERHPRAI